MVAKSAVKKLSERAVLVDLHIRTWSGAKKDRNIEMEVDENHKATEAGNFRKLLVNKKHLHPPFQKANRCRKLFYEMTLPFGKDRRLLPSAAFELFMERMRQAMDEYKEAYTHFVNNCVNLQKERQIELGDLWDEKDFVTERAMRRKWQAEISFEPVPESGHFVVEVEKDILKTMKNELDAKVKNLRDGLSTDLYKRLHIVVKHMAEKLSAEKGRFHDTLVTNINELVDILPLLNVNGDKELDKIAKEVKEKLSGIDPQDLREDVKFKKTKASEAKALLKKLSGYVEDSEEDED